MGETGPKECTIHAAMPARFGRVDVFTPPTVELDRFFVRSVSEPNRQERLTMAKNAGAASEVGLLELFELTGS